MLKNKDIIGVVSSYQSSLSDGLVKNLEIKNVSKALKMVGLDESFLNKSVNELSLSEKFKIDLATKLDKEKYPDVEQEYRFELQKIELQDLTKS